MSYTEKLEDFLEDMRRNGFSPNTIRAYRNDLKEYVQTVDDLGGDYHLEPEAYRHLNRIRETRHPATVARCMSAMRSFGKYCGRDGFLLRYRAPKPPRRDPHPLPNLMNDVRGMCQVAKRVDEKALITLCGMVGLRVSEALSLTLQNFDLPNQTLTFMGKGSKMRRVPIGEEAFLNLMAHLLETREKWGTSARLFPMTERNARRMVKRIGAEAGVKREVASHDLRMTFATYMYNQTQNIRVVQELLGHSSVATTEKYIGVTEDSLRDAVNLPPVR